MTSKRRLLGTFLLSLSVASLAPGATHRVSSIPQLTTASARVFRGVCEKADPGTVMVAGARLAMTTYTFQVLEGLKATSGGKVVFRQVGTPEGGAADLGRLAGLPVYSTGREYLLFVLPESRAGLTSPAGAAEGAFEIVGDRAVALGAKPVGTDARSYAEIRRQVLESRGR